MTPGIIAMAVYKPAPDLLRGQVESIRQQTLTDWTCHIGIDGWDPDAAAAIDACVSGDPRFVVHHYAENVGFFRNFERVVSEADLRDRWVALCDQDDVWHRDKLQLMVRPLVDEGLLAVSAQAAVVNGTGEHLGVTARSARPLASLMYDNQFTGSISVFSEQAIRTSLPFPEPTDAAYHDHWLGVVSAAMGPVRFLPIVVQQYVQHSNNVLGEERGARLRRRLTSLLGSAGHPLGVARYLATHRWGWRVAMARELLERVDGVPDRQVVQMIADGRARPTLVIDMARAVLRREVPAARGAALAVGALCWGLGIRDERSGDAPRVPGAPDGEPA